MPKPAHRIAAAAIALVALLARPAPAQEATATASAVRAKIKHVFVLFQENHSFDNYFGTYPGADNLASAAAAAHGFKQFDPLGNQWVTPFRMTDPDTEGPSQARPTIFAKMNGGKMDAFVSEQERATAKYAPAAAQAVGLLTMGHYDCDTIPYLWSYASHFTLFDRVFSAMGGPSTPNNIAVIAAQAGQTQAARDPAEAMKPDDRGRGVPAFDDLDPSSGPYPDGRPDEKLQIPQAYATLMLTLGGVDDARIVESTDGVGRDVGATIASGRAPVPWGWYQEGFVNSKLALPGYVTHHNAPQYFAYVRDNDVLWRNVHSGAALLEEINDGALPDSGVFYLKGSQINAFELKPANPDPYVQKRYLGDDDHPGAGNSDHQIAEAFVATYVNAIAKSKYWDDSAIVIAWDDPGGYYDHVPPPVFETCPDGFPCGDGPRVPLILISPYARSGAIVHDAGDTASIVKLVETVFGLPPMASLPEEQPYMPQGPRDGSPAITDLLGAFDPARLDGSAAPIPKEAALINDVAVPPAESCRTLGIAPVVLPGTSPQPPQGFVPRVPH